MHKNHLSFDGLIIDPEVQAYIRTADEYFFAIGYKEHGSRHAQLSANIAGNVLRFLDFPSRDVELARIAGYMHDIGNAIGKTDHGQNSAIMTLDILERLKMPYPEIFPVISAIGSHEDRGAETPSAIAAAVILGDKTDVHHSRIRTTDPALLDMHGRVNYACHRAFLNVHKDAKTIALELTIDTSICPVMDYFEIFMARIKFCRKASRALGCEFELYINKDKFL